MEDGASIDALVARLYAEMVDDAVGELTFAAVKSVKRARQPCSVCHTYCQADHASAASSSKAQPASVASKADIMLSCLNCDRPMASTRYAQHLSSCMGLGNSRRGAVRTTAQKLIQDTDLNSPYVESDSGGEGAKGKAKALADAAKPNGKGKKRERPADGARKPSPKKQKVSPTKAVVPQHAMSNPSSAGSGAASAPAPQVKGTGPPKRQVFLPLRPTGAPIAPPISSASSRPAYAGASRPSSSSSIIPSRLGGSPLSSEPSSLPANGAPAGTGPPSARSHEKLMATPPTHPGSYLDKYTSQQTQFPGANWIQKTPAPPSPPHADADEIVDTDSSDDED